MTTSGIASTALDFLATIDPQVPVWDDGGIEGFVEQVHALATQKRHARDQCGIQRAIAALCAEVDSLPADGFEIDLGPLETADIASIDVALVVQRIEALTAAIAAYRREATWTADGSSRTIAERVASYQAMGSSLSLITEYHNELVKCFPSPNRVATSTKPTVVPISRRRHNSIPVTREMWTVAYFLARYGRRDGGGPASAPAELGGIAWKDAFHRFYISFNDGRNAH